MSSIQRPQMSAVRLFTVRRLIVLLSLSFAFAACEGKIESPAEEAVAGETTAGEMTSETTADETTAGETTAGEMTSETTAGEMTSETTAGETTASETTAGETTAGDNPGEMITEENPTEMPSEEPTRVSLDELDRTAIDEEAESEEVSLIEPEPIPTLERPRRRMNLDQLDSALRQVSGGLFWSEVRNGQEQSLFESLSATLGKPDFIQSTNEDLTASALFMKFMDDAARQVCAKRIDLDLAALDDPRAESASAQVLLWGDLSPDLSEGEDSSAVDAQIRALVLRFHSHELPEGDSPRLAYWRWLFETASLVDHSPLSGWRALCVALINHPDFYSY